MAPTTRLRSGRSASTSTSSSSSRPTKANASAKQPSLRASLKSTKVAKSASTKPKEKPSISEAAAIKSAAKSLSVTGKVKLEDGPAERDRPVDAEKTNVHLLARVKGENGGEQVVHPASETAARKQANGADATADNVLEKAVAHILSHAPQLASLIEANPCVPFTSSGLQDILDPFQSLASGIISQQVSGAAAKSIKRKFVALFNPDAPEGEGKFPTPEQVLAKDVATLRTAGLSQRKAEYVQSLADAFVKEEVNMELFMNSTNDEITERLTQIRGIGVWSAEMFLLFHLRRLDVFSTGDLGIQRGMAVLAGKNVKALKTGGKGKWKYMSEKDMLEMAEKFRPYRSIFMWYMWKMSDTEVESMSAASKAKGKANGKGKGKKQEENEAGDDE